MKEELSILLKRHEGLRLFPYQCTERYWTIGYGRNLETKGLTLDEFLHLRLIAYPESGLISILKERGITKQEAEYLLSNDIDTFTIEVSNCIPFFEKLPKKAKIVLVNMAFNMGTSRMLKFEETLKFLERHQFLEASIEMLDSEWARKQVGGRANELSEMIKNLKT